MRELQHNMSPLIPSYSGMKILIPALVLIATLPSGQAFQRQLHARRTTHSFARIGHDEHFHAVRVTGSAVDEDCTSPTPSPATSATSDHSDAITSRRSFYSKAAAAALTTLAATSVMPSSATAFDKVFPDELSQMDNPNAGITLGSRTNSGQRASAAAAVKEQRRNNIIQFSVKNDLVPSLAWGGALWLLAGSRSNPLATPLANVLYDEEKAPWLKDRNAGLFAPLPIPLLLLLGVVFACLGVVTDYLLLQLAEGDSGVCLQLAGVSLIGGGALELGRIASGEKRATREVFDRSSQLREEFQVFAQNRLSPGGSCHRTDIVSAFRRYYGKYRDAESTQYPLTNLEIERLLREWNEMQAGAERTSSGFYYGIQINKDADVFTSSQL